MFTLRMQNIIAIFILKSSQSSCDKYGNFIIKIFALYIKLRKSRGLPYVINIHNIP